MNNLYSEWLTIIFGVPQQSILLPLLFNILSGLFFIHGYIDIANFFIHGDIDIANFTDENATCTFAKSIDML